VRYRDAGGWHWLGDAVAEQDDSLPAQADPVILPGNSGLLFKTMLGAAVGHVRQGRLTYKRFTSYRPRNGIVDLKSGIDTYEWPPLIAGDGRVAFATGPSTVTVMLRNGAVVEDPPRGRPCLFDHAGRLWCYLAGPQPRFVVYEGPDSAQMSLEKYGYFGEIAETTDGAVWIADGLGITQLKLEGAGRDMELSVGGRWDWPLPWTLRFQLAADDAGGLWMYSDNGIARHINLPGAARVCSAAIPAAVLTTQPAAGPLPDRSDPALTDAFISYRE